MDTGNRKNVAPGKVKVPKMNTTTIADTLADQHREKRQRQQGQYSHLVRKAAAGGSLTKAEMDELDGVLIPLGLTPENVQGHTEIVQRYHQLSKDVAAGGFTEGEIKQDRDRLAAELSASRIDERRAEVLTRLAAEEDDYRRQLKAAQRALADLTAKRQELVAVEDEFGWLLTVPPAAKKKNDTDSRPPPGGGEIARASRPQAACPWCTNAHVPRSTQIADLTP